MNWEQVEGKWDQVKGQVKEQWGKLTDNDLAQLQGKKEQMIGKLHERYGYDKQRAEKELDNFAKSCNCGTGMKSKLSPIKHSG